MGFLVLIIIIGVVGFIALKISEARNNHLKKKIEEIRRQYPLAYKEFVSKNHISVSNAKNSTLATIVDRSKYSWNEDEKRLQEQERKRKETERKYNEIAKLYPNGLKKWSQLNPFSTHEKIVSNKYKIKDYEQAIKKAKEYNIWEKEQDEFRNRCWEISKETMAGFGRYYYDVPFKKLNEEGNQINGKYRVWQFFNASYCIETDLDYTDFEHTRQNTNNLNQFRNRTRYWTIPIYEKIRHFIEQLCNDYSVSIYLCANNKDWDAKSLNYHYYIRENAPFYDFPDDVEVCNPATDAVIDETEIDYDN